MRLLVYTFIFKRHFFEQNSVILLYFNTFHNQKEIFKLQISHVNVLTFLHVYLENSFQKALNLNRNSRYINVFIRICIYP